MKWLPVGVLTLGVAIATYGSDPLFENWGTGAVGDGITDGVELTVPLSGITILVYAPLLLVLVGGTVVAFRAMWLSTRRAELAAQIALGRTRASLISRHVGEGAQHGLIASLGGLFVGGSLRQIQTGFTGVEFVSNSLWIYIAIMMVTLVSFVLAYWIAAAWATRGSVRGIASGQAADAPLAPARRGTRRPGGRIVLWATTTFAVLAILLLIWSQDIMAAGEADGTARLLAAWIAAIIINIGVAIALPAVLIYAGARAGVRASQSLAALIARGARPGSARSLTADGLARPAPMRTAAVSAVVAVMGVAVAGSALYFGIAHTRVVAEDLAPHSSISTVDLAFGASQQAAPAGWAQPLPSGLLEDLHADPALVVIETGVLTPEPREQEAWGDDGLPFMEEVRDQLVAVDPAALDEVVPDAAKVLYLTDGTLWLNGALGSAPSYGPGGVEIEVDGVWADTDEVHGLSPWTGISRPWAEGLWGTAPTSAVMLYPAGDGTVGEALDAYDLEDLDVLDLGGSVDWEESASGVTVAGVTAPFLAIAVAIVVALAWAGQRLRARDQATLLALGATPAALRGAAAIESFVVTAVAGLIGCLGGTLIGPILAAIGSSAPIGAAGPGLMLWNAGHTLSILPWGVLIGLALGAAGIAAAGAALIRVRLDRLSPAQQLTEAQKAGAA